MILEILRIDHFYNESDNIEIAKGKYEMPTSLKKGVKQIKRELKWQKRK